MLAYLNAAVWIGLAGIVAWFVYDGIALYRATPGSTWDRLLAAGRGSATILWQRFVVIVAAGAGALGSFADLLGQPEVGDAIKSALKPEYVAAFTVAVAIVTVLARKRTL